MAAKDKKNKVTRNLSYYMTQNLAHAQSIFSQKLGLKFILCWMIFQLVISCKKHLEELCICVEYIKGFQT